MTYAAALLAAVLLFSVLSVATAPPADAGCAKSHTYTSGSTLTERLAYDFDTGRWMRVRASWGPEGTVSVLGPCRDVNVANINRSTYSRAMYYSSNYSRWAHGDRHWEWGPQGQYVVVITNLPNGTRYRAGAWSTSTRQTVKT